MFRCRFFHSNPALDPETVSHEGMYIEAVHNGTTQLAIILYNKKLITVPLEDVTWIGWVD